MTQIGALFGVDKFIVVSYPGFGTLIPYFGQLYPSTGPFIPSLINLYKCTILYMNFFSLVENTADSVAQTLYNDQF